MGKGEPKLDTPLVQRNIILFLLFALAAAAWAVLAWTPTHMGMHMPTAPSTTTGHHALLFFTTWVVMMVAMMFPPTARMFLAFHKVETGKYLPDDAFALTWIFVTAYLLVWTLTGIAAYAGDLAATATHNTLGPTSAAQFGDAVVIVAGIYQLTPWKALCLSECRTPITLTTWYGDKADAFRMGLLHGIYCVGCYWLLFAALFPLGMSVKAMAVITLIILAEKTLPWPMPVRCVTAVALVLCGAMMIVVSGGAVPSRMG